MQQQQTTGKRWYQNKALAVGGGFLDAGVEFAMRRHQNPDEHMAVSLGMAGATAAAWYFFAPIMWAKTGLDITKAAGTAIQGYRQQSYEEQFSRNAQLGTIGGNFQDTDIGYTSRQRGLQAIQASRLNARSALANEARSLHRL